MRKPQQDRAPVNERIRAKKVRLITEDGEQKGVVDIKEARAYAKERDLDLLLVSPDAKPPVCRVLNYSKHKYEQEQKEKAARKKQKQVHMHEIKLRPHIAEHDFKTKRNHIERFLKAGDRVRVTIMFRGREMAHQDLGKKLLDKVQEDLRSVAEVRSGAKTEGRNMFMVLQPLQGDKKNHEKRASQES